MWLLPSLVWPMLACAGALAEGVGSAVSFGGSLVLTSNYIYRGVSSSNDEPAVQGDLHAALRDGTFFGVWGSSRDGTLDPYANYELQIYLGHRFDLTPAGAPRSPRALITSSGDNRMCPMTIRK